MLGPYAYVVRQLDPYARFGTDMRVCGAPGEICKPAVDTQKDPRVTSLSTAEIGYAATHSLRDVRY
eukprot:3941943-Rhodomonas_salina.3